MDGMTLLAVVIGYNRYNYAPALYRLLTVQFLLLGFTVAPYFFCEMPMAQFVWLGYVGAVGYLGFRSLPRELAVIRHGRWIDATITNVKKARVYRRSQTLDAYDYQATYTALDGKIYPTPKAVASGCTRTVAPTPLAW